MSVKPHESTLVCLACGKPTKPFRADWDGVTVEGALCTKPKCRAIYMTGEQRNAYEEAKKACSNPGTSESPSVSPSFSEDGQS